MTAADVANTKTAEYFLKWFIPRIRKPPLLMRQGFFVNKFFHMEIRKKVPGLEKN